MMCTIYLTTLNILSLLFHIFSLMERGIIIQPEEAVPGLLIESPWHGVQIERVWRFFKKKVLYNKYYENLAGFRSASIAFFRNIGQYADELASLLSGGFEGYNT